MKLDPRKIIPAPPLWLLLAEGRALLESTALLPWLPMLKELPKGDGHPVLVLPGFLASSRSTIILRRFIQSRGYRAHRWKLGINRGYSQAREDAIAKRLVELNDRYGEPVSLVGWSLGGIYARELARRMPTRVRQVITLGSPFAGSGHGTNVRWLYEWVAKHSPDQMGDEFLAEMASPPPVPCTAIYSLTDGVAAWRSTVENDGHEQTENVEVGGAHIGLGFNPRALAVVADRLAQPVGNWQPFEPRDWQKWLFALRKIRSPHPKLVRTTAMLEETLNDLDVSLAASGQEFHAPGDKTESRINNG